MEQKLKTSVIRTVVCLLFIIFPVFSAATEIEEYARLRYVADSLHAVGHTDSAIIEAERAFNIAKRSNTASWLVGTHSSLGVYLRSTGKIDEALMHYDEALKIVTTDEFRRNADEDALEEVAALYLNLSMLHFDMAHKKEAVQYAENAAKWAGMCADKEFQGQIYNAAGPIFTATGQPEKAMEYQAKAYDCAIESGNDDAALRASAYTMLSCDMLGREKDVEEWRERCRILMTRVTATMARLTYYQTECSINIRRGNSLSTIAWLDSILNLDGIQNMPFVVLDCYNNIHVAYGELGQYDKAYEALLKGNALRDSLYEQTKAESLRELTVKYDAKEKELALAVSEASRSNIRFWLVVVLAVLVMTAALFVIYSLRQRHRRQKREAEFAALRHNTERQLTERYVEGLENERTRMARELHDGVCNDLAAIQMILTEENPSSPSLSMLDTCREQVRRISHEMMPPEFNYATIDEVLRYYVLKLGSSTSSVRCTYSSSPSGADWAAVPDNVSLEIYRIVQEAVGNAIKHATAQEISVCMNRTDKGIELTISDNGKPRNTSQTAGIGRRTMRQRAVASGGRLTVDSSPTGTVVRLVLELK